MEENRTSCRFFMQIILSAYFRFVIAKVKQNIFFWELFSDIWVLVTYREYKTKHRSLIFSNQDTVILRTFWILWICSMFNVLCLSLSMTQIVESWHGKFSVYKKMETINNICLLEQKQGNDKDWVILWLVDINVSNVLGND